MSGGRSHFGAGGRGGGRVVGGGRGTSHVNRWMEGGEVGRGWGIGSDGSGGGGREGG